MQTPEQYDDFIASCQAASIRLNPRMLQPPMVFAREDSPRSFVPTEWWAATMRAYQLHVQSPRIQLADSPIEFEDHHTSLEQTFANIVNATVRSYTPPPDQSAVPINAPLTSNANDGCAKAEHYLAATQHAMQTPVDNVSYEDDERIEPVIGWTIIANDEEPVGIMKHLGEYTMLSVAPTRVGNIVFPPGMLFSIRTQRHLRYGAAKEAIGATAIDRIRFLRPTIFAMQPADREVPSVWRTVEPEVRQLTLQTIQSAATLALQHSIRS